MIVVDSNVIAYLMIEGSNTNEVEKVLLKDSEWVAPLLWRSEFRNILTTYIKQSGMALVLAEQIMLNAEELLTEREFSVLSYDVLALAYEKSLSAYDAEYIVLAINFSEPLLTYDKRILKQASEYAIHPAKYLSVN